MKLHFNELWNAVKVQLNTVLMQQLLGGPSRVYLEAEDYSQPEGPEGTEWHRLVIVPSSTLWAPADSDMGPTRSLAFMTRAEGSDFKRPGYDYTITLDAIQDEVENKLVGWSPPGLTRIVMVLPIYLFAGRQALPLWDEDRGLHFNSAQYRLEYNKA